MNIKAIQSELAGLGDATIAESATRFMKTGPGEYGEGDRFRGIRVPVLRKLARQYEALTLGQVDRLLDSPFHEDRLLAALVMVRQFEHGTPAARQKLFDLYVSSADRINNWDIVDVTAPHLMGPHLFKRSRDILYAMARSSILWERRMAILTTFYFIRRNEFDDTLALAKLLLSDEEDLMHKAVGWMLREVGNRDRAREEQFLREHYQQMPRTMLRYAIEKFPDARRKAYLAGRV